MWPLMLLASCLGACAKDETTQFSYSLGFPSSAAAIATENLKVYVFDSSTRCLELVQNTLAGSELPTPLAETPSQNLCLYFDGSRESVRVELAAGEYNVLALGTRGGDNYVVGCSRQVIEPDTVPVSIDLTLIDPTQNVPVSTCQQVSEKCVDGKSC